MKVGYIPYSKDLTHPADRRRIGLLASSTEVELTTSDLAELDLLVLSANCNLSFYLENRQCPIVIDLLDGYLGTRPSFLIDFGRNLLRTLLRKSGLKKLRFTDQLKFACSVADAVVVPSPELGELALKYNDNVFVIPDDHSELFKPFQGKDKSGDQREFGILWNGYAANLDNLQSITQQLELFLGNYDAKLYILAEENYFLFSNTFYRKSTSKRLDKMFPRQREKVEFVLWSVENIISTAKKCDIGIIPIDMSNTLAKLKSENKLLEFWSLGLPTLFTPTRSYLRTATAAGVQEFTVNDQEWYPSLCRCFENVSSLRAVREKIDKFVKQQHSKSELTTLWLNLVCKVASNSSKQF